MRGPQNRRCEERRERSVPDPLEGKDHRVGKQDPKPGCRSSRGRRVRCAGADDTLAGVKDRQARCRVEQNVHGGRGKERTNSLDSENAKDARDQQRIDRRDPGGGAGVAAKGRAESLAHGQGVGDVAGLLVEAENENFGGNLALLLPGISEAQAHGYENDEPDGSERGCELTFHAGTCRAIKKIQTDHYLESAPRQNLRMDRTVTDAGKANSVALRRIPYAAKNWVSLGAGRVYNGRSFTKERGI